jgi:FkbM family methyltransferase
MNKNAVRETRTLLIAINEVLKPEVFWDVGANCGIYSWILKSENPGIEIVLFEPDPTQASLAKRTIDRANLNQVLIIMKAVSDTVGKKKFIVDDVSGATGTFDDSPLRFFSSKYHLSKSITVETVTLDSALDTLKPPDFVKIDVEGCEDRVFRGSKKLITHYKPILLFETYFPKLDDVIRHLESSGYAFFNASDMTGSLIGAQDILALPPRCSGLSDSLYNAWSVCTGNPCKAIKNRENK